MAYTFDVPSILKTEKRQYPVGPKFDFDKGDFVTDGSGNIVMGDAEDTWIAWCIKALSTERYTKWCYSDNLGIETKPIEQYNDTKVKEIWIKRTVEETIMSDPLQRTQSVDRVDIRYFNGDSAEITVVITGRDGKQYEIEKEIALNA